MRGVRNKMNRESADSSRKEGAPSGLRSQKRGCTWDEVGDCSLRRGINQNSIKKDTKEEGSLLGQL